MRQELYIIDRIAKMVECRILDLEERDEVRAEMLVKQECTEPLIGRWIDMHDYKLLLAALALPQDAFVERFPKMVDVSYEDRQNFIKIIETHSDGCAHCSLKRGYDLELDQTIKEVVQENKDEILEMLRAEARAAGANN